MVRMAQPCGKAMGGVVVAVRCNTHRIDTTKC
jgi:hypothetical protein